MEVLTRNGILKRVTIRSLIQMISRRSLFVGAGALALSQLLSGCKGQGQTVLRVSFLKDSMPVQVFQEFERQMSQPAKLDLEPTVQLADLFKQLQTWQQSKSAEHPNRNLLQRLQPWQQSEKPIADLVTLGDYWLASAIQQQLIQPLPLSEISQWQTLPQQWQQLVRRNTRGELDVSGQVWAAPYRWGTLMLVYRVEEFEALGWVPTDWTDLWRPELAQRLSLPDHARVVIGLVLKKLGRSLNQNLTTLDPSELRQLETDLQTLNQQLKFYSSDAYLQPLLIGDTWAAVGWSADILPLIENNPHYAAVVPASGTMIWADLWVHPAPPAQDNSGNQNARPSSANPLMAEWIDFCWQEQIAIQQTILGSGASPVLTALDRSELPSSLQNNPLIFPDLKNSEFLEPLAGAIAQSYHDLWVKTRRQTG